MRAILSRLSLVICSGVAWLSVLKIVFLTVLSDRLSLPNMEDLKRRILKMVSNCNKPKVILNGFPFYK